MQPLVVVIGLAAFAILAAVLIMSNRTSTTPSSSDTWQAFANQVGGRHTRNPLGAAQKVELVARGWPLTIEAWSTLDGPGDSILSYTKLLAAGRFQPLAAFELHVEAREKAQVTFSLTQRGGKAFSTNDPELDARYTFHTTDAAKAGALVRQPAIRQKLLAVYHADGYLDIGPTRDAIGRTVGDSWSVFYGDEDSPLSVARLNDVKDLVAEILDTLAASGAARKP